MMDLFHRIDDAEAIIRGPRGVFKQVPVFRRGTQVYVKASGGFVRLAAYWDGRWGTSNPQVIVVELSDNIPGLLILPPKGAAPRWEGQS